MHTALFYIGVVWLAVLLAAHVMMAVRFGDAVSRALAVDASAFILIGLLLLLTLQSRTAHYLDAALVLGLLSFAQTIVTARFLAGGDLFGR